MINRLALAVFCFALAGCDQWFGTASDPYAVDPKMIKFLDETEPNASLETDLSKLEFTGRDGKSHPLSEYSQGSKNVVLIMTRGFGGSICPYCTTQVSRMIANYDKFRERETEVVIVYPIAQPGDQKQLDVLSSRAVAQLDKKQKVPFPLLLDVELKAVDSLGIRQDLSRPATYILDREGRLQFAYVGTNLADRPSVQALLKQLDQINQAAQRS